MLKLGRIPFLGLLLVVFGCSNDDEAVPMEQEERDIELPAITVLGTTNLAEYQTNIPSTADTIDVRNLTEEIGIEQQLYLIDAREALLSFVTRTEGQTSAWQRDLLTEEIYTKQDYCPQKNLISIFIASGSQNYLTYLFDSLEDLEDRYFLEVYDKNADSCLRYDAGLGRPSAVQDYGSVYGIYRAPSSQERELTIVDLEKDTPARVLRLSSDFNFATVNDRLLYLFFIDGRYEIYDIDDYRLVQEGSNEALTKTSALGFLDTTFVNDQMLYYKLFPSPSIISFAPEVYDFAADTALQPELNLLAIKDAREEELSEAISFSDIEIDLQRNIVVIGYNERFESVKGGIIYTDLEGQVLKTVSLPHEVRDILIWE